MTAKTKMKGANDSQESPSPPPSTLASTSLSSSLSPSSLSSSAYAASQSQRSRDINSRYDNTKANKYTVYNILRWSAYGSLFFTSFLGLTALAETFFGAPEAAVHVTRSALAPVIWIELVACMIADRALALAQTTEDDLNHVAGPSWFWTVVVILQLFAALAIVFGYSSAQELVVAGRGILVVFACLLILQLQHKAAQLLKAQRDAAAASSTDKSASTASTTDERQPLLLKEDGNTTTKPKDRNLNWRSICLHIVLTSSVILLALQAIIRAIDHEDYPPPGVMVPIRNGTYRIHLHCVGGDNSNDMTKGETNAQDTRPPTVILDAGIGVIPSVFWKNVMPEVSKETRVCAYYRAGYGWSDSGPLPQSPKRNALALKEALTGAGEKGPFILVGHSFGGFDMRFFAYAFVEEVVGLALLEPSSELFFDKLTKIDPKQFPEGHGAWDLNTQASVFGAINVFMSPFGLDRIFLLHTIREFSGLPLEGVDIAGSFNNRFLKSVASELRQMSTTAPQQALFSRPRSPLPHFPLTVVVGSRQIKEACNETDYPPYTTTPPPQCTSYEAIWATAWRACMEDLQTSLAVGAELVVAEGAGHMVCVDKPEACVNVIKRLITRVGLERANRGNGQEVRGGNGVPTVESKEFDEYAEEGEEAGELEEVVV
ncbi:hypothetical protein HDV05_004227 [Chytridiales sp. JEL 0842]|nr:hypothetical protein HDV05_004227 [Chytridiales sp. JEL 0842]